MSERLSADLAEHAVKASPPLTVTAAALSGLSLEQWVMIATLVYTVLMTLHLLYKWMKDIRGCKSKTDG